MASIVVRKAAIKDKYISVCNVTVNKNLEIKMDIKEISTLTSV